MVQILLVIAPLLVVVSSTTEATIPAASSYVSASDRLYPQEALQCFASSAIESQKNGKIICPRDRNRFCIKEVINATSRADCGTIPGTHFGRDVWDKRLAQCVYRKCANDCPTEEEDRARIFGGVNGESSSFELLGRMPPPVYNRTSYCCDSNLCNSGNEAVTQVGFISVLSIVAVAYVVNIVV